MSTDTTKPYGLGRRKEAIARVWLSKAPDTRTVNGKPFAEYFVTDALRSTATEPLRMTSQDQTYGFDAKLTGGGLPAQAAALKLALARSLTQVDEGFRKQLKDSGALTRDSRAKERKKFGLKGARRAPQFSKR